MTVEPPHWFKGEKESRVQSPHERVTVIAESLSAPQETAGRCHCGFGCEKTREGVVRRSQETCLTVENGPRFGTCFRVSLVLELRFWRCSALECVEAGTALIQSGSGSFYERKLGMKIALENIAPRDIERRSFEIITQELGDTPLIPGTEPIVKRCIHTSADFDYAQNLRFSQNVVAQALDAIRSGASIITDTKMAASGINQTALARYGGKVCCFISDPDVVNAAAAQGTTRAVAAMDKSAALGEDFIYAIGNAPTALVRLYELINEGKIHPKLVIGVPVGFVNVVQSKELILSSDVPYIVAAGRKGGSNIAACICNALLYMLNTDRPVH